MAYNIKDKLFRLNTNRVDVLITKYLEYLGYINGRTIKVQNWKLLRAISDSDVYPDSILASLVISKIKSTGIKITFQGSDGQ